MVEPLSADPSVRPHQRKVYIGDGVYALMDLHYGDLILTTENGIETTNSIMIERWAWRELVNFVNQCQGLKDV